MMSQKWFRSLLVGGLALGLLGYQPEAPAEKPQLRLKNKAVLLKKQPVVVLQRTSGKTFKPTAKQLRRSFTRLQKAKLVKKWKPVKMGWKDGELIRYKAKIGEVEGGFAYLQLKKIKQEGNKTIVKATMKARTNTFFDKVHRVNNRFSSSFRLYENAPFQYSMNVDQAGTLQHRKLNFRPGPKSGNIKLSVDAKAYKYKGRKISARKWTRNFRVPSNTRDLVSAIYYARALPFKKGRKFGFHVFVTGKLWKIEGQMVKKERLYSMLGSRMTYRIEAHATCISRPGPRRFVRAWITADQYRIPLKIQGKVPYLGYVNANISGYRQSLKSRYIDGRQGGRLRYLLKRK